MGSNSEVEEELIEGLGAAAAGDPGSTQTALGASLSLSWPFLHGASIHTGPLSWGPGPPLHNHIDLSRSVAPFVFLSLPPSPLPIYLCV